MATLNLSGQETEKSIILPKLQRMQTLLNDRKAIWAKLSFEKRKAWVESGKDPIMTIAFNVYKFLKNNFFGQKFYDL